MVSALEQEVMIVPEGDGYPDGLVGGLMQLLLHLYQSYVSGMIVVTVVYIASFKANRMIIYCNWKVSTSTWLYGGWVYFTLMGLNFGAFLLSF